MFSLQTISHINHLIYVFGSSHINEKKPKHDRKRVSLTQIIVITKDGL